MIFKPFLLVCWFMATVMSLVLMNSCVCCSVLAQSLIGAPVQQTPTEKVYESARYLNDMLRLDVLDLVSDKSKNSAICEMDSQGSLYAAAGRINAKTGEDMPPRPGEHDRFYAYGSLKIALEFAGQKTLPKSVDYEVELNSPAKQSLYEEGNGFSPFLVEGSYLCIVRWPIMMSVTPMKDYPDVYLITPIFKSALLDWTSQHKIPAKSDIAPSTDTILRMLSEEKNILEASNCLKFSLAKSPLSDRSQIHQILTYANLDTLGAMLIYQLINQQDNDAVHNVEESIVEFVESNKASENFRYNVALAVFLSSIQSINHHGLLREAISHRNKDANTSERLEQILTILNIKK